MAKPIVAITIGKKYTGTENPADKDEMKRLLNGADACITSWEVASLDAEIMATADSLKAVVHMGGSVKRLVSDELFEKGVKVFGASPVLAELVL